MVISSFACRQTEALFDGRGSRYCTLGVVALRKLAMLNAAATLEDLRIPPANRLEALRGDRRGIVPLSRADGAQLKHLRMRTQDGQMRPLGETAGADQRDAHGAAAAGRGLGVDDAPRRRRVRRRVGQQHGHRPLRIRG